MDIQPGDRVTITCQGIRKTGTVQSAINYGQHDADDNWYIEMTTDSQDPVYWKQAVDGGSVRRAETD